MCICICTYVLDRLCVSSISASVCLGRFPRVDMVLSCTNIPSREGAVETGHTVRASGASLPDCAHLVGNMAHICRYSFTPPVSKWPGAPLMALIQSPWRTPGAVLRPSHFLLERCVLPILVSERCCSLSLTRPKQEHPVNGTKTPGPVM